MKLFFHSSDLDGQCSGAILTRRFPEARLFPYNYFYEPSRSIDLVEKEESVIFADITPTPDNLKRLMMMTNDITIFDHHSSSLRELERAHLVFPGIMTEDGVGACALVWEWYCKDKQLPLGIRCISEYDAWERTPENKMFNFGLKSFNTMPTNHIWDKILADDDITVQKILNLGRSHLSFLVPWYKRLVRSYAISGYVDDESGRPENRYTAVLMNQANVDDSIFDDVDGVFDIYLRAVYGKHLCWLVSITTNRDDIDVSKMAERYNGGGHRKSAGFAVDDIYEIFIPSEQLMVK